jgi:hypothetical protein
MTTPSQIDIPAVWNARQRRKQWSEQNHLRVHHPVLNATVREALFKRTSVLNMYSQTTGLLNGCAKRSTMYDTLFIPLIVQLP